jgi:hypothetical protein
MNKNFVLSEKLKLFMQVACNYRALTLGERFPVSIRRSYTYSQSIIIYPERDYPFFTANEIMCFITLASGLNLDSFVETENGVVVIKVSDYSING